MHAWLTVLITIYFYISIDGENVINCGNVGVWSSWSLWQNTNVIPNGHYGLYFQLRRRFCRKNPPNCTTKTKYFCNAFGAEIRLCGTAANFSFHCPNESTVFESTTMIETTGSTMGTMETILVTTATVPTIITPTITKIVKPTTTIAVATLPTRSTAPSILITTAAASAVTDTTPTPAAAVNTTADTILAAGTTEVAIPTSDAAITGTRITAVDVLTTTSSAMFATRTTAAAILSTAAATLVTKTTASSILDCCDVPIIATVTSTPAATTPTTVLAVPTTVAVMPTPTAAVSITTTLIPTSAVAVPTMTAAKPTAVLAVTTTKSTATAIKTATVAITSGVETRSIVSSTTMDIVTNSQFRYHHQYVPKNLNERSILQVNKIRTKRQIEICSACDNILTIGLLQPANGERNGQMPIVYGADPLGCRTASIYCDAGPLIRQTAIIYGNEIRTNILAMSSTGMAQITLTCDENIRWRAPHSRISIWNVTCLLRDHPEPTTPPPLITTPKPCSTCTNIIAARVKDPTVIESDGRLIIEYMQNEDGCRVAEIFCSTSDGNAETIIYFNEMKNLPYILNLNGTAMILLVCGDNRRFRPLGSHVNVENVTCLSRDIIRPPTTTMTTLPTTRPILTTAATITPAHCTACKNIQAKQITNLKPNETNGALAIEYWRQADGCRIANVICGSAKRGTTARIYLNDEVNLPIISDTTGKAQIELICGNNARWRTSGSDVDVAKISCLVIEKLPTPNYTTIVVIVTPPPTPMLTTPGCHAQWSIWEPWSICTDICGAYGSRQRFRGCRQTREDCFCPGSVSDTEFCNLQPCLYPRNACRQNYMVSSVNQKFVCIPIQ